MVTVRLLYRSARKPPRHGEHNKRQRQQGTGQRHEAFAILLGQGQSEAEKDGQLLEGIVAESTLKLGDDQAPETAFAFREQGLAGRIALVLHVENSDPETCGAFRGGSSDRESGVHIRKGQLTQVSIGRAVLFGCD